MSDPLFWLVLSLLFVTVSLTIVLVVAIPALRELSRAARSAEKLFDTLRREFPPTLQAIRLTGLEISDLTEDVSEGVQSAGHVVKQVDQSLTEVRQQAQRVQSSTRSVVIGIKAAWRTFTQPPKSTSHRRVIDRSTAYRSDEFEESSLDSGRSTEMLSESTRPKARRLASEEGLAPPSIARKPEPTPGDPSHPVNRENRLAPPAPDKTDRLRSSFPPQPEASSGEVNPYRLEPKPMNVSSEDASNEE